MVFFAFGTGASEGKLTTSLWEKHIGNGTQIAVYPASGDNVELYVKTLRRDKGPRALGAIPRLGIGVRMSTSVWPAVWPALEWVWAPEWVWAT